MNGKLLPADTYIVINKTILSEQDKKKITLLYDNFLLPEIYSKRGLKPARAYAEYTSLYKKLAIKMNDELKKAGIADRFKVLENSLKYTEVMKNNSYLEETTKQFYKLG